MVYWIWQGFELACDLSTPTLQICFNNRGFLLIGDFGRRKGTGASPPVLELPPPAARKFRTQSVSSRGVTRRRNTSLNTQRELHFRALLTQENITLEISTELKTERSNAYRS